MTLSQVIEVLREAAEITEMFSTIATPGDWRAEREVVHAPHWHRDRQGEDCYPLVGQNGADPEADTQWAALLDPRSGPPLVAMFNRAADHAEASGDTESWFVQIPYGMAVRIVKKAAQVKAL